MSVPAISPVLTKAQLRAITNLSIPTIDRLLKSGGGPKVVCLSARRIGFRLSDVEEWLKSRAS